MIPFETTLRTICRDRSLLKNASRADLEQAKLAAGLIMARGYNRGRDLTSELRRVSVGGT